MKRQNEINAVDALLQIMPFITGMDYCCERFPDDETSQRKEVDFILTNKCAGQISLAIEHTIVEAFRGQITYVNRSYNIVSEVAVRCNGKLPLDRYYYLVVPDELVGALHRQAILRFVDTVSLWVLKIAPTLQIDGHANMLYEDNSVLLVCGGSHVTANGTIGRIPGRPNDQESLAEKSLWFAIEHGLDKFSKYKDDGYETLLCLQDISGEVHPSMLIKIENDRERKALITGLIDYLIVFASVDDIMVVGNVWKEHDLLYNPSPFNRRFQNEKGVWLPLE